MLERVVRHIFMLLSLSCACASGGEGEAGANGAGGTGGVAGHAGGGVGGAGGIGGAGGVEGVCGNGVVESDEACDQRDFGGKTCESYGLGPGTLICNSFCQVVVTSCSAG